MMKDDTTARVHEVSGSRIAVVGPCASGKSTLVEGLRRLGYDAYVSGQEHSEIATLWDHLHPEFVIGLTIDLATLRSRRGSTWPKTLYETQLRRLEHAYSRADLVIDTARLDATGAVARAESFLAGRAARAAADAEATLPG